MTRKYKDTWPEDKVATLRKLWASDFTASEIAAEMGISRSAVLGKVHRLGLDARAARGPARFNFGPKPRKPTPRSVMLVTPTGRTLTIKKARPSVKIAHAPGQSKTSASYRSQFGIAREMTVKQRRDFLAEAFRNTAGMAAQ